MILHTELGRAAKGGNFLVRKEGAQASWNKDLGLLERNIKNMARAEEALHAN